MSKRDFKLWRFLAIGGCLIAGILFRLSNHQFVFDGFMGHMNFIDTDCYYHLRRLVHFVENFPRVMMFDPLLNWPAGGWVDWPEGFLLLLGIPLKLIGVDNFQELESGVVTQMILLGLCSAVVTMLLAERLLKSLWMPVVILFMVSVNFLLVRLSCLGQVDHHIVEAIIPPALLLLTDRVFTENKRRDRVFLGILLAASFLISSSSLFGVGAFFALYALVYGRRENIPEFLKISGLGLFLLFGFALWSMSVRGYRGSIAHPSYFHIGLVSAFIVSAALFVRFKSRAIVVVPVILAAVCCAWIFNFPPTVMGSLKNAVSYVFNREGILAFVSEAAPIFMDYHSISFRFMNMNFGYLVFLLPLVWIFSILFWKRMVQTDQAFLLWLSLMSVPGIFQKRFSHLMVCGFIIFLGWLIMKSREVLPKINQFGWNLMTGLIVVLTIAPHLEYAWTVGSFAPSGSPRDRIDLTTVKAFVSKLDIKESDSWNRLASKSPVEWGIWANPNMGHVMTYWTGYPSLTNSFYHGEALDRDFQLRALKTEEELHRSLENEKIRYAILSDDFAYLEMLYQLRGIKDADLVRVQNVEGRRARVYQLQNIEKFAYARIVINHRDVPGFQRLFSFRFPEQHLYNFIKGIEVTRLK